MLLLLLLLFPEPNYDSFSSFSPGDFKSLGSKTTTSEEENPAVESPSVEADMEKNEPQLQSAAATAFTCPEEGCVRVIQRLSALDKHLSLEKCTKSLERYS